MTEPCLCGDPACGRCFPQRGRAPRFMCECADQACPHHPGYDCMASARRGGRVLRRLDMADHPGTRFCAACLDDALASGLYR